MGSLPEADQFWLAENFIALFERDYARIAQLHVAAGWMPSTVRLDELEAAVRTVCEPYFTRPLAQISIAELVVKLFQTARKFELTLQPQLILLQKTLLNIEGVGRMLDPEIDIWAVAHPVLRRILRERYSLRATLRDVRRRLPQWVHTAPQVPELVRDALRQVASGQQHQVADPLALAVARDDARRMRRLVACSLLGSSLLVCAALVGTLAARGTWPAIVATVAGVIAFAAGWPRRVA
jgi:ubiquinone biosynthesis protein